jgi:hypothetical protein
MQESQLTVQTSALCWQHPVLRWELRWRAGEVGNTGLRCATLTAGRQDNQIWLLYRKARGRASSKNGAEWPRLRSILSDGCVPFLGDARGRSMTHRAQWAPGTGLERNITANLGYTHIRPATCVFPPILLYNGKRCWFAPAVVDYTAVVRGNSHLPNKALSRRFRE